MANSGLYDYTHAVNEGNLDQICMNSRSRANGQGVNVNPNSVNTALGVNYMQGVGTPTSISASTAQTLTATQLGTGIITINATAALTATFDTAANIVGYVNNNSAGAVVGDVMQVLLVNGQATNAITLAAGSGGSFDTNQATRTIAASTSKYCYIRLTNVTGGSEAYTIYF